MSTTAKTTKAAKAKLLRLTSRAKSPKRPAKKIQSQAPAITDLKTTLAASIEHVAAQAPVVPGLDGDAGTPAEQVGEPVEVAKTAHAPAEHDAGLLALITRPEGATVREMLSATGWTHSALKTHVTTVIRKQLGYTISTQRNSEVDAADRARTMYIYFATKA